MDQELTIPVTYRGQELSFPLRIVPQGFAYRFVVPMGEAEVIYERDEAGELRALTAKPEQDRALPDAELVAAVGDVLRSLME